MPEKQFISTPLTTAKVAPDPPITSLRFENAGEKALSAGVTTFAQVFVRGELRPNQTLSATIDGKTSAVQLDAKTTYADGSIRMAVLAVERPALAADREAVVHLTATGSGGGPALSFSDLLARHSFTVALTDSRGRKTDVDVLDALKGALGDQTASVWLSGPLATQARVEVDLPGSMRAIFDVTAFKGGGMSVEAQFNNDEAMTKDGGRQAYEVVITMNGKRVAKEQVDQGQYQNWHQSFVTGADGGQGLGSRKDGWLNIKHDVAHLQATGAIAEYDLGVKVNESLLNAWDKATRSDRFDDPLDPRGVLQNMPQTGGRDDIGFTTKANTAWLMSQDARAANFAMGQAEATGAVPWNFWDTKADRWLGTDQYPKLWVDPRGGSAAWSTGLTQKPDKATGWETDPAHQPDLSFVPYLLTGERWLLDSLNAQAAWNVLAQSPLYRGNDELVVVNNQVRGAAWALRQIDEAAWVSPNGSVDQKYFTAASNANWAWLVKQIPRWTAEQGEAHGWLPGDYGTKGALPPWQQDYFASTALAASRHGNADARTFLEWQSNFLVGRFTQQAQGFGGHDGAAYLIAIADPSTGIPYKTWAEIGAATVARGWSNGQGWAKSEGDYAQLALASLAGIAEVTGNTQAAAIWRQLRAEGAPFTDQASFSRDPTYAIAAPDRGGSPVPKPMPETVYLPTLPDPHPPLPIPQQVTDHAANQGMAPLSLVVRRDAGSADPIAVIFVDGAVKFLGRITAPIGGAATVLPLGDVVVGAQHVVQVRFLDDVSNVPGNNGRSLHIDDVRLGHVSTGQSATLREHGEATFTVGKADQPTTGGVIGTFGQGGNVLRIGLSQDAWNGDARFTVLLDGVVIAKDQVTPAAHATSDIAYLDVRGDFAAGTHGLVVRFQNDAWGGSPDRDRNLFVDSLSLDGTDLRQRADLRAQGDASFRFDVLPPNSPVAGQETLRIGLSGDRWNGDPRYVLEVDGRRVGGERTVTADRRDGEVEYVSIAVPDDGAPHKLNVRFLNDAWGGTQTADRNLYVESLSVDGVDLNVRVALLSNSDALFAF